MTDTTTQAVTALLDTARAAQADAKAYRDANGITQIAPGFVPLMIDTLAAVLFERDNATAEAHGAGDERASWKMAAEECELECKALRAQLASALDKLELEKTLTDGAHASARESALQALAAYGQAAEAHEAQLAAEAMLAVAVDALKKIATGTAPEADPDTGELIECWMDADEMREIAIAAIRAADPVTKSS